MKAISLFSGIGGFDLAMERAGIELVGMCEIDKHAQEVLRKHFQNVPLIEDVKQIGKDQYGHENIRFAYKFIDNDTDVNIYEILFINYYKPILNKEFNNTFSISEFSKYASFDFDEIGVNLEFRYADIFTNHKIIYKGENNVK